MSLCYEVIFLGEQSEEGGHARAELLRPHTHPAVCGALKGFKRGLKRCAEYGNNEQGYDECTDFLTGGAGGCCGDTPAGFVAIKFGDDGKQTTECAFQMSFQYFSYGFALYPMILDLSCGGSSLDPQRIREGLEA